MLRTRKSSLTRTFARHGITLNHALLDDPKRHLISPRPATSRLGQAVSSLQEVMEDLHSMTQPVPSRS